MTLQLPKYREVDSWEDTGVDLSGCNTLQDIQDQLRKRNLDSYDVTVALEHAGVHFWGVVLKHEVYSLTAHVVEFCTCWSDSDGGKFNQTRMAHFDPVDTKAYMGSYCLSYYEVWLKKELAEASLNGVLNREFRKRVSQVESRVLDIEGWKNQIRDQQANLKVDRIQMDLIIRCMVEHGLSTETAQRTMEQIFQDVEERT